MVFPKRPLVLQWDLLHQQFQGTIFLLVGLTYSENVFFPPLEVHLTAGTQKMKVGGLVQMILLFQLGGIFTFHVRFCRGGVTPSILVSNPFF